MTTENTVLLTGQEREDYIKAHFAPETVVPDELMIESTVTVDEQDDYEKWYDGKDEGTQELIDEISDRTRHIIDESDYDEFIEELDSKGITASDEFEDRFEAEFLYKSDLIGWVEELIYECDYLKDVPDFIKNHIDYQSIWECELSYDYSLIEFNNRLYLFNNCR